MGGQDRRDKAWQARQTGEMMAQNPIDDVLDAGTEMARALQDLANDVAYLGSPRKNLVMVDRYEMQALVDAWCNAYARARIGDS